ncbi:putative non-specific serine/threonine protein kinase [Helianthus annuus]|nr:putative non-specific serine/threonine protein kinase [Helianthus annuus]
MVLKVGLMCSNDEPSSRPSMRQVIRYLEREAPVPEIVGPSCYGVVMEIDQHAPALVKLKSL